MDSKPIARMNFDAWSELARTDPEAFESMRLAAIEAVIERAPEANRERLRRLQWRIDQERRLARTPMAACLQISRMMWRAVLGPNGLHERFGELRRVCYGLGPGPTREKAAPGRVVTLGHRPD